MKNVSRVHLTVEVNLAHGAGGYDDSMTLGEMKSSSIKYSINKVKKALEKDSNINIFGEPEVISIFVKD